MKRTLLLLTALISLAVKGQVTYTEHFDVNGNWWLNGNAGAYNAKTYTNPGDPVGDQFSSNSVIRESTLCASLPYAWRINKSAVYYFRYECQETVQSFSIQAAKWANTINVYVRYSTNSGTTYTNIDTLTNADFAVAQVYQLKSYTFATPISPETGLKVYIEFQSNSAERMLYDDFQLTYIPAIPPNPVGFDAAPASTTQNNLSWALNASSDSVMIAHNTVNSFGAPSGVYSVGQEISGGGTVLYKGTGTSTSHTGLDPDTKYYYKAWSKGVSGLYSTGMLDSATTFKVEPSEYPSGFSVADTGITITAKWTDAAGDQPPDGYLVKLSNADNIAAPVDGSAVADDRDMTDGTAALNVTQGTGNVKFFRLQANTTYFVKIFPYTNSGTAINYLTDDPAPSGNAMTQSILNLNDFESNSFGLWDTINLTNSHKNWVIYSGAGAYGSSYYANVNGFQGTGKPDTLENTWLISPSLNLDSYTDEKMIFFNWYRYGSDPNELKLLYSNDYISGNPTYATWTELSFTKPSVEQVWVASGFIDLSGIISSNFHVAFHYLSTSSPRSWNIDEIEITGVGVADPASFNAYTISMDQINLAWTKNSYDNDVMVAWNTTNTFGIPDGNYSEGDDIIGGGTVLYRGPDQNYMHTGLFAGTMFYYKAWSFDNSGYYSSGLVDSAATQYLEPTDHPTGLAAVSNGPSSMTVSWTDSDAAHYLIKGSSVGYSNIVPPIDGVGQSDSVLVKNVNAAVQSKIFTGLTPNTTYYFKIFPYNGTGESSNYKTDGTVPEISGTTDDLNLNVFISEIAESNDNSNIRFVEIYNAGTSPFNFTLNPIYLCKQSNGGSTWNYTQLTGIIAAGGCQTVAYSAAYFDTAYSTTANQYNGNLCNFNGDDGIFLYFGGPNQTGTLIDSYGQVNVTGDSTTTGWNYLDGHVVRKRNVTNCNPIWTADEWVILKKINYNQMTPYVHNADLIWQGTTTTDWNTRGSNWSGTRGWVPDASCNVTIPNVANYPIVTRKSACNQLEIQSGSSLGIQSTGKLYIIGQ